MTGQVRVRVTPFTAWILDTTKESGLEVLVGGWEPFDLWVCVSAQPVISRRFPLHDGRETGGRGTRALPSELAIGSIPDRARRREQCKNQHAPGQVVRVGSREWGRVT